MEILINEFDASFFVKLQTEKIEIARLVLVLNTHPTKDLDSIHDLIIDLRKPNLAA